METRIFDKRTTKVERYVKFWMPIDDAHMLLEELKRVKGDTYSEEVANFIYKIDEVVSPSRQE